MTEKSLKRSIVLPLAILAIALIFIGMSYAQDGEIFKRGIDLAGGAQITVHYSEPVDASAFSAKLMSEFGTTDIDVVTTTDPATRIQKTVVVSIGGEITQEQAIPVIENYLGITLEPTTYSILVLGPALASSFWIQAQWALAFAFIFMACVIAFFYRKVLPAVAIIISTVYDLIIIVGFMALFQIPLTLATVAALLMIIGYGVDTNVLLTNKILKEKDGDLYARLTAGMKTGLTMSATTISVLLMLFLVGGAYSIVLRQMSAILLIGLIADIPNTWCLNANILVWRQKQKA